jgi:uncharacterized membrane protein
VLDFLAANQRYGRNMLVLIGIPIVVIGFALRFNALLLLIVSTVLMYLFVFRF